MPNTILRPTFPSPFKNANEMLLLRALFYEVRSTSSDFSFVRYSLRDKDIEVNGVFLPSLYKLYMEMEDFTEFEFATTYLDSYEHWEKLCECNWFKPYVLRWRKELDLKIAARNLKKIVQHAKSDKSESIQAAKYLIEKGWLRNTKGRPSHKEIKEELIKQVEYKQSIDEDLLRVKAISAVT